MRCSRARKDLTALLDGELSESRRRAILGHLERCAGCAGQYEALERSVSLLEKISGIEPSPAFEAGFRQKLDQQRQEEAGKGREGPVVEGGPWLRLHWRPAFAGACLAATFAFVVYLNDRGSMTAEPSPEEIRIAAQLDFLMEYDLIRNLELLENFEEIESL